MDTLGNLLGGGQLGDIQDFLQRHEQGAPADGISDQEALDHHQLLATQVSPEQGEQAAGEAFRRMAPEEREQLGQQFQQGAQAQGLDLGGLLGGGGLGQLRDPGR
jgi:hypothetical protein